MQISQKRSISKAHPKFLFTSFKRNIKIFSINEFLSLITLIFYIYNILFPLREYYTAMIIFLLVVLPENHNFVCFKLLLHFCFWNFSTNNQKFQNMFFFSILKCSNLFYTHIWSAKVIFFTIRKKYTLFLIINILCYINVSKQVVLYT